MNQELTSKIKNLFTNESIVILRHPSLPCQSVNQENSSAINLEIRQRLNNDEKTAQACTRSGYCGEIGRTSQTDGKPNRRYDSGRNERLLYVYENIRNKCYMYASTFLLFSVEFKVGTLIPFRSPQMNCCSISYDCAYSIPVRTLCLENFFSAFRLPPFAVFIVLCVRENWFSIFVPEWVWDRDDKNGFSECR